MVKEEVITAFKNEFHFVAEKFEVMDLLAENSPMDYDVISNLKLPSAENNIAWHPGVYVFIGNETIYRVGRSMNNSRHRVCQHLNDWTTKNGHCIWDIDKHSDRSILLFNVKQLTDRHWLMSLEMYLEERFKPLIYAGRIG